MEFYLAPMEGLTGHIVRNAFHHNFNQIDKYYTPFIPAAKGMSKKIERDIHPDNNKGIKVIPQIMSNKADEVIHLGKQLREYGYDEININFGCPSGTVSSKKRGSGFLAYPDEMEAFLDDLFSRIDIKISIKTRVGYTDDNDWKRIAEIYSRYPICELTVHPRIRTDFYKPILRLNDFAIAVDTINQKQTPLCYNGDIVDKESFFRISEQFSTVERFMIGRGLIARPGLIMDIKGELTDMEDYRKRLRAYHDEIVNEYQQLYQGQKDTLYRMKEHWSYLHNNFHDCDKYLKKIKKSQNLTEYGLIVNAIFNDCDIKMGEFTHIKSY